MTSLPNFNALSNIQFSNFLCMHQRCLFVLSIFFENEFQLFEVILSLFSLCLWNRMVIFCFSFYFENFHYLILSWGAIAIWSCFFCFSKNDFMDICNKLNRFNLIWPVQIFGEGILIFIVEGTNIGGSKHFVMGVLLGLLHQDQYYNCSILINSSFWNHLNYPNYNFDFLTWYCSISYSNIYIDASFRCDF